MKKAAAFIFCAVALAGCATYIPPDYVGWRESRLIGELGVPHSTYKSGGHTYLEYNFEDSYKTTETTHCEEDGDETVCHTVGGEQRKEICTLTFTMRNRVVRSFRRRGGDWTCMNYEHWARVEES